MIPVPGLTPRLPLIKDGPVLVTAVAPRTAKLPAVPISVLVAARVLVVRMVTSTTARIATEISVTTHRG